MEVTLELRAGGKLVLVDGKGYVEALAMTIQPNEGKQIIVSISHDELLDLLKALKLYI